MQYALLSCLLLQQQDPQRIMRDLGSEDYFVRELATARLFRLGQEKAAPTLQQALKHRDPEVRARARAVRNLFEPKHEPPLPHARAYFFACRISSDLIGIIREPGLLQEPALENLELPPPPGRVVVIGIANVDGNIPPFFFIPWRFLDPDNLSLPPTVHRDD